MDRRRFLELSGGSMAALLAGCGGGGSSSGGPTTSGPDWIGLSAELNGQLLLPSNVGYNSARLLANEHFDSIQPAAIIKCASVEDVQHGLEFVRKNGFAVTPRCGGHSWAGASTTTGVVLNVTPMNSVQVNGNGTATVGAGARLAEVYDGLISQGVCIPSGTCLTVGISGITMGGGIGVLDRQFGLTCDNLLSANIVTTDGHQLTCDAANNSDLFWAIRGGGGGNFGIATSFTFQTHPIQDITVARAYFNSSDFADVFKAWQLWPQTLPNNIWGQIYWSFWQGSYFFSVTAYCLGTSSDMQPHWNDFLTATGVSTFNGDSNTGNLSPTVTQRSYRDVAWDMCTGYSLTECSLKDISPTGKTDRYDELLSSDFFNQLIPDAGIQALIDGANEIMNANGVGSYIFDHMGGAIASVAPTDTAFYHRQALFSVEYAVTKIDGFSFDAAYPNRMRSNMSAWSSGGAYVNYLDPLLTNWQTAYYGANYARLQQVKTAYDPNRVLNMAQGVVPG